MSANYCDLCQKEKSPFT